YATYEYDLDGRQSAVTDAGGNRAELRYDGLGRQSCWIFPSKTTPGALGGDCSAGDFEAYQDRPVEPRSGRSPFRQDHAARGYDR
ncbi:MAG: hypothetical protein QOK17_956, partial [Sphingomonadales bacterium]|nr:hypothetical protein [Sphingomonadales bacterium]